MSGDWVARARRLDAMARLGLTYAQDPYDRERYAELAAIARDMLADLAGVAPAQVPDLYLPDAGYVTPKVDVRAAVADGGGRVLLVRERADGRWSLPGGWADVGVSAGGNAVREVREEAGFEVRAVGLVGCYDEALWRDPPSAQATYKLVVRCELTGGEAVASTVETDGVGFFGRDDLPPLSAGRTPPRILEQVFAALAGPLGPAHLD